MDFIKQSFGIDADEEVDAEELVRENAELENMIEQHKKTKKMLKKELEDARFLHGQTLQPVQEGDDDISTPDNDSEFSRQ